MPYTPDATAVTLPADTGYKASSAPAEFRAIKAYMAGNLVPAFTATKLLTPRTINGTSFDGTANITVTAAGSTLTGTSLAASIVSSALTSLGTLTSLTVSGLATHSAGMTAGNANNATTNILDWYQEGTFTPTITFGGAAVGVTYGYQEGTYTRIGNRVFFTIRMNLSSKGSSAGVASIAGFPYSTASSFAPPQGMVNNLSASFSAGGGNGRQTVFNLNIAGSVAGVSYLCNEFGGAISDTDCTNTSSFTFAGMYIAP